jgi:hypothetical protein
VSSSQSTADTTETRADEGVLFTNLSDNVGLDEMQWTGVLTAWGIPESGKGTMDAEELDGVMTTDLLKFVRECVQASG